MTKLRIWAFVGVMLLAFSLTASADSFSEIGDAGQTPGTAQCATGSSANSLDSITGTLDANNADVFCIVLKAGVLFTATTVSDTDNFFDTQLWLFDSDGLGLVGNDDDGIAGGSQSTISFLPGTDGIYYLAISGFNYFPTSAGGFIFPLEDFVTVLPTDILGPTGPGGSQPLNGFVGASGESGTYDIQLSGATPVPEPTSMVLFGSGIVALLVRRRRK